MTDVRVVKGDDVPEMVMRPSWAWHCWDCGWASLEHHSEDDARQAAGGHVCRPEDLARLEAIDRERRFGE